MSSILKALKKLEAEKLLQQETAGIHVSSEILRKQPESRKAVLWLWITGVIAFATIATLAVLLLRRPPVKEAVVTIPAAPLPANEAILAPAAGAVVTTPPPRTGVKTVTSQLAAPEESYRQQIKPALPPPHPSDGKSSSTEMPASHFPTLDTPRAESGKKPMQTTAPEQTETSLTLSGIAWNKDSAERLAIINGQPAATGTTVSGGVVIEEILPDRVKVNSAGRSFEIFLGKPAKSN